ncbi:MAG: tRNA (adenosine(37)-N6)-threonylcarbamoyltransferase complex ATPase subunit type 1 TsaE [Bacillota bacterium]
MQQAEAFLTTSREEETVHVGELLGHYLNKPLVIALQGELGTGKTVFVRGIARGLGVEEQVSSPTFVLLKIYPARLPLYHFDFYRLSEDEDHSELGFEEYLPGEGIACIEWAERLPHLLPPEYLQIRLERPDLQEPEQRRIWFAPRGPLAVEMVEDIFEAVTWRTNGSLHRVLPGG